MTQRRITDDLHALLGVLPPHIAEAVVAANNSDNLLEIVIDLGRHPMARFTDGDLELLDRRYHPRRDRLRGHAHRRVRRR